METRESMKITKYLFLLLFYSLLLIACNTEEDPYSPITMRVNENEATISYPIPDSGIVFLSGTLKDVGDKRVVFIDASGVEKAHFQHSRSIEYEQRLTWTDDGKYIFLPNPSGIIDVFKEKGSMRIRGLKANIIVPIHGTHEILAESSVGDTWAIKRINIETGEIIDIYLLNDWFEGWNLGLNAFYDEKLLYRRWRWDDDSREKIYSEIVELNTKTNNEHIVVSANYHNMVNPSYSPDGKWIAYTDDNRKERSISIFLIRPDGRENHEIIKIIKSHWMPAASWSPDGKWIVYHRCVSVSERDCELRYENQAIFKYNIETGEEFMLAEYGVFPYWHWPEEE